MLRCPRVFTCLMVVAVLSACGGGSEDTPPPVPQHPATQGTLKADVTVVNSSRDAWVASATDASWTLHSVRNDIAVGAVLLLDDDAVRVTGVTQVDGTTILGVVPAEIEEVFAKLRLSHVIDMSDATFEATDGSATLVSRNALVQDRAQAAAGLQQAIHVAIDRHPFTGSVDFVLGGRLDLSYDEDGSTGAQGHLDVTGAIDGAVRSSFVGPFPLSPRIPASLAAYQLGTVRIPIPVTIVDKASRVLGVRVASIVVPVWLGADGTGGYSLALRVNGDARTNLVVDYSGSGGLVAHGPMASAGFGVTGELADAGPDAAAQVGADLGAYVRALPQLLILNKVPSMGADLKVGMYADGQLSAFPGAPYYCLRMQPSLKSEVSGFFRAAGIDRQSSSLTSGSLNVGAPYSTGECREGNSVAIHAPQAGAEVAYLGENMEVSFSVGPADPSRAAPTGSVEVTLQGASCVAQLIDGAGRCSVLVTSAAWSQIVTVKYLGDTVYRDSQSTVLVHAGGLSWNNAIKLTSGSCTLSSPDSSEQLVELHGTASGEVGARVVARLESDIAGSAGSSSYASCPGWTGFGIIDGLWQGCIRRPDESPITTWSAKITRNGHTGVRAELLEWHPMPSHFPQPLALVRQAAVPCPGSITYP